MSSIPSVLKVQQICLRLGGTQILNGVEFSVRKGETVGIIGPNGSGKTTLFNCLSGFHYPDSGKIIFGDADVTQQSPFLRARMGVGRVFQNPAVFSEMTVLENVILAIESRVSIWKTIWPWSAANTRHRAQAFEYLKEVRLDGLAKSKAASLSGGQKRLLEIVRILAFGAELFLLDEPTAGVSPKMKDEVAQLIKKLQELNKTVLIIEHDLQFIQKFCSRIIVLDVGRVMLDGTPQAVRENPQLQEIYFGERSSSGH